MLGLTWGGGDHPWSSAHVIATLVVGFFVCVGFILWQWKGAKFPLVPRELNLQTAVRLRLIEAPSTYLQVKDREWRMYHYGNQRMELCRAGVLHPRLLSTSLRVLSNKIRRHASSSHFDADAFQHSGRPRGTQSWALPRMYPARLGDVGRRHRFDVNARRVLKRGEASWILATRWCRCWQYITAVSDAEKPVSNYRVELTNTPQGTDRDPGRCK